MSGNGPADQPETVLGTRRSRQIYVLIYEFAPMPAGQRRSRVVLASKKARRTP
jgi:hypothetical protein